MIFIVLGLCWFMLLHWAWHKLIFCQHEMENWVLSKVAGLAFLVQSALLEWLWELPAAKELRRYGANFNVCLIN